MKQKRIIQTKFGFDRSELEYDQEKLKQFISALEKSVGHNAKIAGILEMGAHSKGEATPFSDIDTRIYISSPEAYVWQENGSRLSDSQKVQMESSLKEFLVQEGELPIKRYNWYEFNNPLADKISRELNTNVEFGLVDIRYALFELGRMDISSTIEHHLILQGNILYDSDGILEKQRQLMVGIKCFPLMEFYQERFLDTLPFEIYEHLKPHNWDVEKLRKSKQIQWVKWAVRCLRDAVASKTYIASGNFVYKKDDVLEFYKKHLPEHFGFVQRIYSWKTDSVERLAMVEDFINDPDKYFQTFRDSMPELEKVVKEIRDLRL